jgi:hypothetical protein
MVHWLPIFLLLELILVHRLKLRKLLEKWYAIVFFILNRSLP